MYTFLTTPLVLAHDIYLLFRFFGFPFGGTALDNPRGGFIVDIRDATLFGSADGTDAGRAYARSPLMRIYGENYDPWARCRVADRTFGFDQLLGGEPARLGGSSAAGGAAGWGWGAGPTSGAVVLPATVEAGFESPRQLIDDFLSCCPLWSRNLLPVYLFVALRVGLLLLTIPTAVSFTLKVGLGGPPRGHSWT